MKTEAEIWEMINELMEDCENGFISRRECVDKVFILKRVLSDEE